MNMTVRSHHLTSAQRQNEEILKMLAEGAEGIFGTMQQAIDELNLPRLKSTRPVPSFRGKLTLGNPETCAICIDIERYPRVMIRRPLAASNFVQRTGQTNGDESSHTLINDLEMPETGPSSNSNPLTNVSNERTYQVRDENAPGGKRDVTRDELARGYEYGRTAVHISESDYTITKLETIQGLEILGFVPWAKVSLAEL